jgi:hypothetical protein
MQSLLLLGLQVAYWKALPQRAPEIRTYVVPLDNIWSGSAF